MRKLWFYFNALQLADSFTDFANVKSPANLEMVKKAYKDIIHVKMLPDSVIKSMQEQVGISKATHERKLAVEASTVLRNQLVIGGAATGIFLIGLILFVMRKRIWKSLSQKMQQRLTSVRDMFFWNFFIRCLLELYYPILLAAMVAIFAEPAAARAEYA